jgi:ribosomal protein S12 methylthiotransferase accessory factor
MWQTVFLRSDRLTNQFIHMPNTPQTDSFILGKDASLESTIAKLQGKLRDLGIEIEERSWLNPVDGIWSVHIRDKDCTILFANGKGATKLACMASALGEFFERLATNYFWTHFYLGQTVASSEFVHYPQEKWIPLKESKKKLWPWPKEILNKELHAFYNPQGSIDARQLIDFNSGNTERGICTIPYTRERDGSTTYIPVNIIGNLYVSNGMSAGNTKLEARTQALSEIFERTVKGKIIGQSICLPDVPEAVLNRYPRIQAGIQALREAGFGIVVKDASLGGKYPVMNVTLLHPKDQGCFASFGAHPRFEIALERALTELLQGRALDTLTGFPPPGFDLDEVASSTNIEIHFVDSSGVIHWKFLGDQPDYPFVDWNFAESTAQDYQWCVDRIHKDGFDIYTSDFTHLGVYACRILVPGMSEIYPVDDLEFENNGFANDIREAILNLTDLDDEECSDLLETLNESGMADTRPIANMIGLVSDANTIWSDLRLGELKTMLALASGDEAASLEGCEWVRHFGQINPERRDVYACVENLLKLNDTEKVANTGHHKNYTAVLNLMHGQLVVQKAQALIDQKNRFFGISAPGLMLEGCDMHQRLLKAYAKVGSAKKLEPANQ